MKPVQLFSAYLEFASCASEGVADLIEDVTDPSELLRDESGGYFPHGIPSTATERSHFDWLALSLYFIFSTFCRGKLSFYKQILVELETVKTDAQIGELLEIEEKHAAVELVGYDDQWARLEIIKNALSDEINK